MSMMGFPLESVGNMLVGMFAEFNSEMRVVANAVFFKWEMMGVCIRVDIAGGLVVGSGGLALAKSSS